MIQHDPTLTIRSLDIPDSEVVATIERMIAESLNGGRVLLVVPHHQTPVTIARLFRLHGFKVPKKTEPRHIFGRVDGKLWRIFIERSPVTPAARKQMMARRRHLQAKQRKREAKRQRDLAHVVAVRPSDVCPRCASRVKRVIHLGPPRTVTICCSKHGCRFKITEPYPL